MRLSPMREIVVSFITSAMLCAPVGKTSQLRLVLLCYEKETWEKQDFSTACPSYKSSYARTRGKRLPGDGQWG